MLKTNQKLKAIMEAINVKIVTQICHSAKSGKSVMININGMISKLGQTMARTIR
jgi:hypothetical protein